jgi:tetratricopeptide (TPR) repeat protein
MPEEEIIILETDDEEEDSSPSKKEQEQEAQEKLEDKKKKLVILGSIVGVVLLVIIIVIVLFLKNSQENANIVDINTTELAKKINKRDNIPQFSPSRLENMIKKANLLYERGNKEEALKIYKKIATFNEAISYYNIGVAKIKEKNYKGAIEAFKKAISNGEQRCVSAINAGVAALELKNYDLFKYYIDLAYSYLPLENNSPLYSYYMGLINYYKKYYYESLASFRHPSSKFYNYEQKYLSSKILASFDLNYKAVANLESIAKVDDALTLGLLYARLGEFKVAKNYLTKAIQNTQNPLHVKASLALVENKLGNLKTSADLMNEIYKQYKDKALKVYPIKVILKKSLFDINIAQDEFDKTLFFDNRRTYSLLFYFAPFKVFNAKQTVDYIRKGSINIFIDEIGPALSYLKKSSTISKVNISISQGIKKALSHHTEQANQIFLKMIKSYPKHSILHYNLALTYAQMADFTRAYKHFKKSYHLNTNNYLAGIFAVMCGQILNENVKKLKEDVASSIDSDEKLPKVNLYMSLLHLSDNNQLSMSRWLEEDKKKTPLNLVFDIIIAQKIFNEKIYRQKAILLKSILPRDIMANIINFNVKYKKNDIKKYAKAIQIEFKKLDLNYNAFYYGARLVQESYVKLLQIGGLLYHERANLIKKVELERDDIPAIMQTLAYVSIYTHNFEEAYVLYNKLIDDMGKNDSATVFLASVASIGAGHVENAVALLELSKLINGKRYEARYALGLLYQEIENWEGAMIQYKKIGDSSFKSKYFSFEINR